MSRAPRNKEPLEPRSSGGIRYVDSQTESDLAPLVLLHGLGNSIHFWDLVIPRIGRHRRVVALDIPGYGKSPTPDAGFSIDNVTHEIRQFLDAHGVNQPVLCGHSMGAVVALSVAGQDPDGFEGLVLVSGHLISALRALQNPTRHVLTGPRQLAAVAAQFAGGIIPLPRSLARMITANQMARSVLFRPFVADPARVDPAVLYDALEDNGGINVLRALCLARQLDFEELMKAARVPVALIWGSRDLLLRESDCVRTSELMHVVGTAELPGIGHWPMLEAPADLGRLLSGSLESVHYPIAAEK